MAQEIRPCLCAARSGRRLPVATPDRCSAVHTRYLHTEHSAHGTNSLTRLFMFPFPRNTALRFIKRVDFLQPLCLLHSIQATVDHRYQLFVWKKCTRSVKIQPPSAPTTNTTTITTPRNSWYGTGAGSAHHPETHFARAVEKSSAGRLRSSSPSPSPPAPTGTL